MCERLALPERLETDGLAGRRMCPICCFTHGGPPESGQSGQYQAPLIAKTGAEFQGQDATVGQVSRKSQRYSRIAGLRRFASTHWSLMYFPDLLGMAGSSPRRLGGRDPSRAHD